MTLLLIGFFLSGAIVAGLTVHLIWHYKTKIDMTKVEWMEEIRVKFTEIKSMLYEIRLIEEERRKK